MLDQLHFADVCHNLHSAISQPMGWALQQVGVDSDFEDEVLEPQEVWKLTRPGEEEEEGDDEDEEEAECEQEACRAQEVSERSTFTWGTQLSISPLTAFQPESPLLSLVRNIRKGLLCIHEDGDDMEKRRLFEAESIFAGVSELTEVAVAANPVFPESSEVEGGHGTRYIGPGSPRVALGRYEYRLHDVIGSGGFSSVRRGVDLVTGRCVAIKTYSGMEYHDGVDGAEPEDAADLIKQFEDEVRMLTVLHTTPAACRPSFDSSSFLLIEGMREVGKQIFEGLPPSRELFVELIDFSRSGDGEPCPSDVARSHLQSRTPSRYSQHQPRPAANGQCYLVLELASETLEQYLSQLRAPLSGPEVQRIFREVCEVVAALHSHGFVHLDLKPGNFMRFPSGRFKLIDMDGMQSCGASVPISDIICTPKYCAPEVAIASLQDDASAQEVRLKISRLLDVFSLGLIGAELVSGVHPLEDVWRRLAGGEAEDEVGFLQYLGNPDLEVPLPPAVREISVEFEHLLQSMLRTQGRASMPEVLASPFLRRDLGSAPQAAPPAASLQATTTQAVVPQTVGPQAAAAPHAQPSQASTPAAIPQTLNRQRAASQVAIHQTTGGPQAMGSPTTGTHVAALKAVTTQAAAPQAAITQASDPQVCTPRGPRGSVQQVATPQAKRFNYSPMVSKAETDPAHWNKQCQRSWEVRGRPSGALPAGGA